MQTSTLFCLISDAFAGMNGMSSSLASAKAADLSDLESY